MAEVNGNNRGRAYETNKLPGNVAMLEKTIKLLWQTQAS